MKAFILTLLVLLTLTCSAGGRDSTNCILLKPTQANREINLRLNSRNRELSTNGALTLASGVMFSTIGFLLEKERIQRNIPNGLNGYSLGKDLFLNYGILTIGVSLSTTGSIMIFKSR